MKFRALLVVGCGLAWASFASADEKPGKGKSGESKPGILQIDPSKLPPDLLKQLEKYTAKPPMKGQSPQAKPSETQKPKFSAMNLPPGLANKATNHPGRMAFLKAMSQPKSESEPSAKPRKPSQESNPKAEIQRKIDQLQQQLESLKKQLKEMK